MFSQSDLWCHPDVRSVLALLIYLAIFYRILDLSGVNAYVIYTSCTNAPSIERGRFMQSLARELVVLHLNRRVYNTHLPRKLTLTIKPILGNNFLPKEPEDHEEVVISQKRKLCNICPSKLKRKTPSSVYQV